MKCPLLTIGLVNPAGLREGKWNDCLKEECQWYNASINACAHYLIPKELDEIKELLAKLLKKKGGRQ